MRFTHLLSVNLFVGTTDFVTLRRFYEEALDIPFGRIATTLVSFYTRSTSLACMRADEETRGLVGRSTGVVLRTREEGNLVRLIQRLRGKGYTCNDDDFGPFRGGHRMHVADPGGNRITLWEPDGDDDSPNMYDGPGSVTVAVRDIRRAIGFYTATLEMPMGDQPDRHTAVFFPGDTNLILCDRPSWSPAEPVRGETGVVFATRDPHSMLDNLRGRGVTIVEGPTFTGEAVGAVFEDVDGNRYTMLGRE